MNEQSLHWKMIYTMPAKFAAGRTVIQPSLSSDSITPVVLTLKYGSLTGL